MLYGSMYLYDVWLYVPVYMMYGSTCMMYGSIYLYAGEVGVAVGQDYEEVGLHIHHTQNEVLPPVVLEDPQEPGLRRHTWTQ